MMTREAIEIGLEKVKEVIQNNYVHRADAESVKGIFEKPGGTALSIR